MAITAASIFMVEFAVMILFAAFRLPPWLHGYPEALIDAVVLTVALVPILHYTLSVPLLHHIMDSQQANSSLHALNLDLELRVEQRTVEVDKSNRQMGLLAESSHLLQACASAKDVSDVVARAARHVLPDTTGVLFSYNTSGGLLEPVGRWGELAAGECIAVADECWAFRRGRGHTWSAIPALASPAHTWGPCRPRMCACP